MYIMDIEIHAGRIAAIGEKLAPSRGRVLDTAGLLASPLFIDPHHHLDCAFLIDPPNKSGTLDEAIEINARIKNERPECDVIEKACRALDLALQNGTGWIRNHGDIDSVLKIKAALPDYGGKRTLPGSGRSPDCVVSAAGIDIRSRVR